MENLASRWRMKIAWCAREVALGRALMKGGQGDGWCKGLFDKMRHRGGPLWRHDASGASLCAGVPARRRRGRIQGQDHQFHRGPGRRRRLRPICAHPGATSGTPSARQSQCGRSEHDGRCWHAGHQLALQCRPARWAHHWHHPALCAGGAAFGHQGGAFRTYEILLARQPQRRGLHRGHLEGPGHR